MRAEVSSKMLEQALNSSKSRVQVVPINQLSTGRYYPPTQLDTIQLVSEI